MIYWQSAGAEPNAPGSPGGWFGCALARRRPPTVNVRRMDRTPSRPHVGRAFTLLELLIALVLTGVLMTGLWTLFSTYEKLFSRGQAQVADAQLIRGLLEQITTDLKCAIPDDAPEPSRFRRSAGASDSLERRTRCRWTCCR